ncbi:MAG: EamA family transporter [Sneathiellales bacterium]|nr:EamA family transporter [Sneathiellales bacterium]
MTLPHVGLALLVNLIWGFSFVAAKVGVDHYGPLLFTGIRFLLVALCLAPFLKLEKGSMKMILAIGLLVGILHFTFLYIGLFVAGGVSAVAITIQLVAPFSLVLAIVFLKESIGWRRILGLVLAFGGVMLLGFDPIVFNHLDGVALVALAALCMAGGIILMRLAKGVGTMTMQAWIAVISCPALLAFSFVVEHGQIEAVLDFDFIPISAMIYTVIATTVIAHGSWYYLLQRYPVAVLTPYGLLAPVFGVAFGVFLYNEPITWKFILGSALTLVGVFVINIRTATKTAEA